MKAPGRQRVARVGFVDEWRDWGIRGILKPFVSHRRRSSYPMRDGSSSSYGFLLRGTIPRSLLIFTLYKKPVKQTHFVA